MSDPFVAEIRILGCNFAPKGWAFCNGQLMPISQNTALFSLVGTVYGGDGKATFGLPDLQGRAPMHPGQGPGLELHDLGEVGGSERVTLQLSETASHTHAWNASNQDATVQGPGGQLTAGGVGGISMYAAPSAMTALTASSVTPAGGNLPHNNLQPYLTVNFCIALQGIYPPRG
jgi:microcystin-dependent protein